MQPVLQLDRVVADEAGGDPDHDRCVDRHVAGRRRDRGEAGDGTGEQADEVRLLRIPPLDEQPRHRRERGCDVGIEEGDCGDVVDLELAASVEPVPTKPQQARAERDERDVVRRVDELAPADVQHRRERGPAGAGVDDDAAGEVTSAPVREQTAAPEHMHERVVDSELPDDEEEQVCLERHPVRECACDERGCDDREHHLVGDQHDEWDAGGLIERVNTDVAQERQMEVAVDPIRSAVEAERVADRPPEHGRDPHRREALDHDRQGVRAADEPAVEEREPGCHQHHQARGKKHESGVCSVEHCPSFRRRAARWTIREQPAATGSARTISPRPSSVTPTRGQLRRPGVQPGPGCGSGARAIQRSAGRR